MHGVAVSSWTSVNANIGALGGREAGEDPGVVSHRTQKCDLSHLSIVQADEFLQ